MFPVFVNTSCMLSVANRTLLIWLSKLLHVKPGMQWYFEFYFFHFYSRSIAVALLLAPSLQLCEELPACWLLAAFQMARLQRGRGHRAVA